MNLFLIAWRSIQQRGLASILTMLSMGLGVLLVVAVLVIHGIVEESFRNNAGLGYNMIVGAKGGKLQLTLNTVYYLSQPVENISYQYYLEFFNKQRRNDEYQNALKTYDSRDGKFAQFTDLAIPVCLGDYFGEYRVVGTTPAMFDDLKFGPELERRYDFAQGRNFKTWSDDHGFFEAVVGSRVAQTMNVKLGDKIAPSHGAADGKAHAEAFTVVGILRPTGTPNDRAAFVNMEGFYLMENHSKPLEEEPAADGEKPATKKVETKPSPQQKALPIEQREITAMLVRTSHPMYSIGMQNVINEGKDAQAVLPIAEITRLFEFIVRPVQTVLLVLTALICVVSGIGILVSIYNSMSDRRHEIAVMRALGASRDKVMFVILAESVVLSVFGGVLGWIGAHVGAYLSSPLVEAQTGVRVSLVTFSPLELWLIPGLILLAILVGLLPAFSAYRTDVAKSLSN